MLRLRHLNLDKAVNQFLQNVEGLSRAPLITDDDMLRLWGEEVMDNLCALSDYNKKEKVCSNCAKSCCPLVHCEFYYPGFSQCPIFPYRPAICRMHFCERFTVSDISFIREFADIFLNSLLEAVNQRIPMVEFLDSPPLTKYAPDLVTRVSGWIEAFKEGRLDEPSALNFIQAEAGKFISPSKTAALNIPLPAGK